MKNDLRDSGELNSSDLDSANYERFLRGHDRVSRLGTGIGGVYELQRFLWVKRSS